MSHSASPPALILGSGITALGVARSLGREGISTYYASSESDYVEHSRWVQTIHARLDEFAEPDELGRFLATLPFEQMVPIPCSDSWALTLAGLAPALSRRFPTSIAAAEKLHTVGDKVRFAELAQRCGLPHPRTTPLSTEDDLRALPDDHFVGSFLKPCNSQAFSARFGVKALQVASRQEALSLFAAVKQAGLCVALQEYIPGPARNHYYIDAFVDRGGTILARFARQRLRMHAPFSNSSCLRSMPLDELPDIVPLIDRLIGSLQPLRGMVSTEMKRDERDGVLKIIEVNARAWKHVEFAATCGVNICKLAYEDALGLPSRPIAGYKEDVHCVDLARDLPHCWRLFRRDQLTMRAWLRSWWGAQGTVACVDDPLPAVYRSAALLRLLLGRDRRPD